MTDTKVLKKFAVKQTVTTISEYKGSVLAESEEQAMEKTQENGKYTDHDIGRTEKVKSVETVYEVTEA